MNLSMLDLVFGWYDAGFDKLYILSKIIDLFKYVFIGDINHRYTDINETCKQIKKY